MLHWGYSPCTKPFCNLSIWISLIAMGCCLPLLLLQLPEQYSYELGMFQKAASLSFLQLLISFLTGPISQHITPYHDTENSCCSVCLSVNLRKSELTLSWGALPQGCSLSPTTVKIAKKNRRGKIKREKKKRGGGGEKEEGKSEKRKLI